MSIRPLAALLVFFASASTAETLAPKYLLRYDAPTETMAVRICVPTASATQHFTADGDASRYIDQMKRDKASPPVRNEHGWSAADWRAGECLTYRAALGRIADRRGDGGTRRGTDLMVEPQKWLLRVDDAADGPPAEVSIELPRGFSISAPWHPLPSTDGARRFSIPPTPDDWSAHIAIGRFTEVPIDGPGGVLRLAMLGNEDVGQREKIAEWIRRASRATLSAYGRLPLADVQLLVLPGMRESGPGGESTRGQGHALLLSVDPAQSPDALDRGWVAVHELSHMFHPYLGDRGSWLSEGLATYYQNVLRARAGLLTPAQAWEQIDAGFDRGRSAMPRGNKDTLERAADAIDDRPNFMRIYWSGTAFWLETDVELRRSTGNRLSVDEALRRFDACCLPDYRGWSPEDFIAKLDELAGTDVFHKRFDAYRARRDFPDLDPIYRELGLHRKGKDLVVDDGAPAAAVRRAIMAAPAPTTAR